MAKISQKQRDDIVEQFLPRVKYYAGKYSFALPAGLSYEDLVSAGIVGLLDAVERFDESHKASLSTFADFRIRGAIIDEIRSMQWASKDVRKKLDDVRRVYSTLEKEYNRSVTEEEVAERMNISLDELHKTLSTTNILNMLHLEDLGLSRDGEGLDILECISDGSGRDILDELNLKELTVVLGKAISELPEKERLVLTFYYYEELNMKEIGKVLEISESRVCQLHGKALLRLRDKVEAFNTRK